MHDQPLVVPGREPARLARTRPSCRSSCPCARTWSTARLWKSRNAQCSPAMIRFSSLRGSPMIARAVGAARQVLEQPAALDLELDVVGRVVELLLGDRPGAVDRVEVERRRAAVARRLPGRSAAPSRERGVEGHVVVEELAEERRPRRVGRVVRVVRRSATRSTISCLRARPRADRAASSRPPGLPELAQRRLDLRPLLRERRQPEDPPEVLGAGRRPAWAHGACAAAGAGAATAPAGSSATAPALAPPRPETACG